MSTIGYFNVQCRHLKSTTPRLAPGQISEIQNFINPCGTPKGLFYFYSLEILINVSWKCPIPLNYMKLFSGYSDHSL